MRTILLSLFVSALLLFIAGSASGFSINHTTNYDGTSALQTSDTVTVHVFLDTEGAGAKSTDSGAGLATISIGVAFTAPQLEYVPGALSPPSSYAYLNYLYPPYYSYVTPDHGSQSSYILYAKPQPATGTFLGNSGGYMVPAQAPWQTWPLPQPGEGQVNFNWIPPSLPVFDQQTRASSNTWLGSIVLRVNSTAGGSAETGLFVDGTCCTVFTGDGVQHRSTTTVDARTQLTLDGPMTPSATPTSTPTPTPTPTSACQVLWPKKTIVTIGKGQSPSDNPKVVNFITGNIVDPTSLGETAHRIPVCEGTLVNVLVTDTTGIPTVTANSGGITCTGSTCVVMTISATEKYIARSSDGKDTDRMTLLPR